ncbi:hypothetical protein PAPYR_4406 [Paratrimastix pyriformis]|uniref:Bromo domain-containing protein n=1 Tax=Paratrimastix pyriformis TaxID=342808 RepID=A0ABQ8UKA8_9EUKA|nr:hypothetical protein PAPYR_4406 [Paratrimastix pyriformis]
MKMLDWNDDEVVSADSAPKKVAKKRRTKYRASSSDLESRISNLISKSLESCQQAAAAPIPLPDLSEAPVAPVTFKPDSSKLSFPERKLAQLNDISEATLDRTLSKDELKLLLESRAIPVSEKNPRKITLVVTLLQAMRDGRISANRSPSPSPESDLAWETELPEVSSPLLWDDTFPLSQPPPHEDHPHEDHQHEDHQHEDHQHEDHPHEDHPHEETSLATKMRIQIIDDDTSLPAPFPEGAEKWLRKPLKVGDQLALLLQSYDRFCAFYREPMRQRERSRLLPRDGSGRSTVYYRPTAQRKQPVDFVQVVRVSTPGHFVGKTAVGESEISNWQDVAVVGLEGKNLGLLPFVPRLFCDTGEFLISRELYLAEGPAISQWVTVPFAKNAACTSARFETIVVLWAEEREDDWVFQANQEINLVSPWDCTVVGNSGRGASWAHPAASVRSLFRKRATRVRTGAVSATPSPVNPPSQEETTKNMIRPENVEGYLLRNHTVFESNPVLSTSSSATSHLNAQQLIEICHNVLLAHICSDFFLAPEVGDDYRTVIDRPLFFDNISEGVHGEAYKSLEAYEADVGLCLDNTIRYTLYPAIGLWPKFFTHISTVFPRKFGRFRNKRLFVTFFSIVNSPRADCLFAGSRFELTRCGSILA